MRKISATISNQKDIDRIDIRSEGARPRTARNKMLRRGTSFQANSSPMAVPKGQRSAFRVLKDPKATLTRKEVGKRIQASKTPSYCVNEE